MSFMEKHKQKAVKRGGGPDSSAVSFGEVNAALERQILDCEADIAVLRKWAGLDPLELPYELGELVEGKGIFFGTWDVLDPRFSKRGKKFYVYAAPEDLSAFPGLLATWHYASKELAEKKGWYGHGGREYWEEARLRNDLINGDYGGEWFVPPRSFLDGVDADGVAVRKETLFALRHTGAFGGTLCEEDENSAYWSCTKALSGNRDYYSVVFRTGEAEVDIGYLCRKRCRPFRLEPVPFPAFD
ncbi:MAG: hypothetical protein PHE27_01870 [Alphaproteobacteria bacterium]|nr:hypothetical protein [Alphaproteobacteria bacterium]